MELNQQCGNLWEVVRKYENQPFVQIAAHKEIHALTKSILQLYETVPLILNSSHNKNSQLEPFYEDTTSLFPEVTIKSHTKDKPIVDIDFYSIFLNTSLPSINWFCATVYYFW